LHPLVVSLAMYVLYGSFIQLALMLKTFAALLRSYLFSVCISFSYCQHGFICSVHWLLVHNFVLLVLFLVLVSFLL